MCGVYMKPVLRFVLGFVLGCIGFFFRNRKVIVFTSDPQLSDNPLVFFKFLRERLDVSYRFVWLVAEKKQACKDLHREGICLSTVKLVNRSSLVSKYYAATSLLNIDSHGSFSLPRFFKRNVNLSLWHGSPLKRIGRDTEEGRLFNTDTDLLISSAELFSPILSSGLGVDLENISITGQPRNDLLVGGAGENKNTEWGQYIMWMPTYTISRGSPEYSDGYKCADFDVGEDSFGALDINVFDELDAHLDLCDVKLIVKLHPYDIRNNKKYKQYRNIIILKWDDARILGTGLYRSLFYSQGLISDFSSVLFDYMLTGKPIGVDRSLLEKSARKYAFEVDFTEFSGVEVSDKESFYAFIEKVSRLRPEMERGQPVFFNKYNDSVAGMFCENVWAELVRIGVFHA